METTVEMAKVAGTASDRSGSPDRSGSHADKHFGTSIPWSRDEYFDPDACPFCHHYEFWSKDYKRSDHIKNCAKIYLTGDQDSTVSDDYYKASAGTGTKLTLSDDFAHFYVGSIIADKQSFIRPEDNGVIK